MISRLLLKGIRIDWSRIDESSYLKRIKAISGVEDIVFHKPVTFFAGENGSGKSTLLEAIAVAYGFNPEGGTRNYSFSTHDSHSELHYAIRLIKGVRRASTGFFLRAESFYNVATMEEEYSRGPGGVPAKYHERSHGESFLKMAQDYFRPDGLFLFDEPEAALSPQRQLTFLAEIYRCARRGGQFLIATHSPILLGMPDAEILSFDEERISPCSYEDTESFRVISLFLQNREQILKRLL